MERVQVSEQPLTRPRLSLTEWESLCRIGFEERTTLLGLDGDGADVDKLIFWPLLGGASFTLKLVSSASVPSDCPFSPARVLGAYKDGRMPSDIWLVDGFECFYLSLFLPARF